jgi:Type II CAAX prenyl endopeptidase Rce1-like
MKKVILATKRHWNWKVFFVLLGLIIPASFAIVPYSLHLQNVSFGWDVLVLDRLVNSILPLSLLGGIGLVLANRIGLGMPFVERWVKREHIPYSFRSIAAIAWITAVVLVLSSLFLHTVVFDAPLNTILGKLGLTMPKGADTPPLYGFLAALSAGITEETLYRLFGLSLLARLGGLLFHDSDGRPKPIVFWTANVLFALAFGAAHLPTEAAIGLPLNPLVVTATLVLNGIGGLVFGWLFWTFGLESAMLAHFLADAIKLTLIPLVTMQEGETTRYLAITVLVVVILVTLFWASQSLMKEGRNPRPQMIH